MKFLLIPYGIGVVAFTILAYGIKIDIPNQRKIMMIVLWPLAVGQIIHKAFSERNK